MIETGGRRRGARVSLQFRLQLAGDAYTFNLSRSNSMAIMVCRCRTEKVLSMQRLVIGVSAQRVWKVPVVWLLAEPDRAASLLQMVDWQVHQSYAVHIEAKQKISIRV